MPGEAEHAKRRRATLEEIERSRIKLVTLGAQAATAVEGNTAGLFDVLDDALSLSATRVLQSGVMCWVGAYRAQTTLLQGVWQTLMAPPRPRRQRSAVINGRITFFMDQYTEASEPVLTEIPQGTKVSVTDLALTADSPHRIPKERVNFSHPSNRGSQTCIVSLSGLGTLMQRLPPGTYHGRLFWTSNGRDRRQVIDAVVSRTQD